MMVLFGILTNKNGINHVRTEIASMSGEISSVRTDLRAEITSVRNELRAEITSVHTELGAIRAQAHADTLTLVNISNEMDRRITRLEDKD
jgi:phage-related protein